MDDVVVVPADYRSSSKFGHDALAEALWIVSLDSGQDNEAGTTDTIGWFALFHFDQAETVALDDTSDAPTVTVPRGSYILQVDDRGFVDAARYGFDSREVRDEWAAIERDAAPTHLSRTDSLTVAVCGEESDKLNADINVVDCEDCLREHDAVIRRDRYTNH